MAKKIVKATRARRMKDDSSVNRQANRLANQLLKNILDVLPEAKGVTVKEVRARLRAKQRAMRA